MSRIPNCREDEYYNEKYLRGRDRDFVDGFDYASECAADNYFDNMDVYYDEFDIEGEDINLARFLENHPKIFERLRETQKHWIEMQRDDVITAAIDNMDEDLYEKAFNECNKVSLAERVQEQTISVERCDFYDNRERKESGESGS